MVKLKYKYIYFIKFKLSTSKENCIFIAALCKIPVIGSISIKLPCFKRLGERPFIARFEYGLVCKKCGNEINRDPTPLHEEATIMPL